MRYKAIGVLTVVALVCMPGAMAETVDGIAATVGDEVILLSDLRAEVAPLLDSVRQEVDSERAFEREMENALRDVLDQAVEQKILYREALLAGIEIEEQRVEKQIDEIKSQYASEQEFMQVLQQAGESLSDFRERMRKQIMAISMGMAKRRQFEQEAVVSESDMREYYEAHKDEFVRPARVKVRRIFLSADDAASKAKARARLEQLKEELKLGAGFAQLARAHSEGPDAKEGGLVGWVQRGDLVKPLEEEIFDLAPGEVSEIVETEFGLHLLKAETKEEAGQASFDELRTEIEPILREKAAEQRYKAWMEGLKKRSQVRIFL